MTQTIQKHLPKQFQSSRLIVSNKYFKIKWDYTVAIGFIYEKIDIETELERKDIDVEQEYMCQFTTSRTTVFGHVNEEDYQEVIYL